MGGGRETRGRNEVDAITGATMTCNKVEEILNGVIKTIVEETDSNG
ncbi:MAG: FMN-binding protein [Planctomycetota bacterium]